jgi:hypothetical protein
MTINRTTFRRGLNVLAGLWLDNVALTATAAEVNLNTGQTATAAEVNKLDGAPLDATIVVGAETAHPGHAITCAIQLKDGNGADLTVRGSVLAYLAKDAAGDAIQDITPTAVAAGTDGLAIVLDTVKAYQLVSEADGDIDLVVTKTDGAGTCYLILVLPNGKLVASGAITFSA